MSNLQKPVRVLLIGTAEFFDAMRTDLFNLKAQSPARVQAVINDVGVFDPEHAEACTAVWVYTKEIPEKIREAFEGMTYNHGGKSYEVEIVHKYDETKSSTYKADNELANIKGLAGDAARAELEDLRGQYIALGGEIDNRWKADRLKQEIEKLKEEQSKAAAAGAEDDDEQ